MKKIVGIFIVTLMILTAIPSFGMINELKCNIENKLYDYQDSEIIPGEFIVKFKESPITCDSVDNLNDKYQVISKELKGDMVKLGGVITEYNQRKSKRGDFYGELFFQDLSGRVKILVFKDKWEKLKNNIKLDFPYFLEGRLPDHDETNQNIYLENLTELETFLKKKARKIVIKINYNQLSESFNEKLKNKIDKNKDSVPYIISISSSDGYMAIIGSSEKADGLKPTVSMKKDIEKLTGENTVEILY